MGVFVSFLATLNFRGSFYWPGTFDMSQFGLLHTVAPMGLGCLAGILAAQLWRPKEATFRKVAMALCLLALAWALVDSVRNLGLYSLSPYSLHLALMAVYVASFATAVLVRYAER